MAVPFRRPRPRLLTAIACSSTVLALAGSPGVALADDETVVGQLVQVVPELEHPSDVVEHGGEGPLSWIEPEDGDAVRVPTEDVVDLELGATVEVTLGDEVVDAAADGGLEPSREVLAAEVLEDPPVNPPVAEALAPGSITNEVTVAMVVPAEGAPDATTLAQVVAAVNDSAADFWWTQSDAGVGVGVTGQHDWPGAPYAASCADPIALWDEAQLKTGFVPGPGKHLLLYLPENSAGCEYGYAEWGGSPSSGGRLYVTEALPSLIAHELGHNFGLGHSSAQQCDGSMETGTCRTVGYGDYYDVMGGSWEEMGSLSAAHSYQLGFLDSDEYSVLTAEDGNASFTLSPPSGPQRQIVRAVALIGADGSVYWLEYLTAAGQNAWLGDPARNPGDLQAGLILRRQTESQDPTYSDDGALLLDPTPSASADWDEDLDVVLPVGVPVVIDGADFTITVESLAASHAAFKVLPMMDDPACASRGTVSMSGVSLLTSGGKLSAAVVGLDRGLWLRPVNGSPTSWTSLGGGVAYGPTAVSDGSTSYVFVTGLRGDLWYRADSGSGWGPWTSLGGYLTASPAAASLGTGHVRVFGRGTSGELWSRELVSGSWSGWTPHGGYLTSSPTATADRTNGRVVVVVRGRDGYSYSQSLAAGSGAAPYERVGFVVCSAFAMESVRSGSDPTRGAFLTSSGSPVVVQAGVPQNDGGVFVSAPAVHFGVGYGSYTLAGRGLDNALWVFERGSGTCVCWRSLGGYVR